MIINETYREKGRRIPFGHSVRGLRVYNLELVYDDLTSMLDMDSGELREHIFSLIRCMDYAERGRNSNNTRYAQISQEIAMCHQESARIQDTAYTEEEFKALYQGEFKAPPEQSMPEVSKDFRKMVEIKSTNGICWSEE
jgi:CO/xanthine dehydrogenase Mo-binding subunit